MKPFKKVLIAIAAVWFFWNLLSEFWFDSDAEKAAQCLTVSHFLDEKDARIWSAAAGERISYWVEHDSGCSTPKECMQSQLKLIHKTEQKLHPDGDRPDRELLLKWLKSDFCKTLVTSYVEKSKEAARFNSKQENAPQPRVQPSPQKTTANNANVAGEAIPPTVDATPNTAEDATNKKSGKAWQDNNGFMHYPDGTVSSSPID